MSKLGIVIIIAFVIFIIKVIIGRVREQHSFYKTFISDEERYADYAKRKGFYESARSRVNKAEEEEHRYLSKSHFPSNPSYERKLRAKVDSAIKDAVWKMRKFMDSDDMARFKRNDMEHIRYLYGCFFPY